MFIANNKRSFWASVVAILAILGATQADATLVVQADGKSVLDTETNLYWAKSGNLFLTVSNSTPGGAPALANLVIAAIPTVRDTPNLSNTPPSSGIYAISSADFITTGGNTGKMTWWGAKAWAAYLNTIRYGGFNDWRLPSVAGPNGTQPCQTQCDSSEPGDFIVRKLGGVFLVALNVTHGTNYNLFTPIPNSVYWSGTELAGGPEDAWQYFTAAGLLGEQGTTGKNNIAKAFAWPVRGALASLPIPMLGWPAIALLGFGLTLVGALSNSRR